MSKITNFTINGRQVSAERGETILQVARREGIYIPTMCYLPKTNPSASCRMCVVEAEGVEGFVLSCNTPPTEGAVIVTDSGELYRHRQNIMKLYQDGFISYDVAKANCTNPTDFELRIQGIQGVEYQTRRPFST